MSHFIPTTYVIFLVVCFMCFEPCAHARNFNSPGIENVNPFTSTMKVAEENIKKNVPKRENGYTTASIIYGSYASGPDPSGRGHGRPPTPPHH
ncbi:unnamed protein product [Brassica oleracea var. botrytis]